MKEIKKGMSIEEMDHIEWWNQGQETFIIVLSDNTNYYDDGMQNDLQIYQDVSGHEPIEKCAYVYHGNAIFVFNRKTLRMLEDDLKSHHHTFKTWSIRTDDDGSFVSTMYSYVYHL